MTHFSAKKQLLSDIESLVQTLQKKSIDPRLPPGTSIKITVRLRTHDNHKLEPGTRPKKVGAVFDQLSFFHCGYQKAKWQKVAGVLDLLHNGNKDLIDFLNEESEYELLRCAGWGDVSLAILYDVLLWHGYTEKFKKR